MAIIAIMLYFGWPIIEAILIMLPIPDPKDIKEKIKGLVTRSSSSNTSTTAKPAVKGAGYTGNFNQAPESLQGESDDEEDDIG
jgi:hypothetical protein